ncbi:MAG: hypothetical protein H6592_00020 [Flavobacteriales bacterium]|nr:hypothetical protein [Flavobacteriales bacterium]
MLPRYSTQIIFLLAGVLNPHLTQAQCDFPANTTLRVLLEGPLDTTTMLMNDELRTAGLLPLAEPYTALGHQFRGGGNETIDPSVLLPEGPDAIVDWVVVEVRHPNDPGRVLYSRSALLQRDGDVVGLDGLNGVELCVEAGKYHISVRHRNHLGIMTGSPLEYYQGQFGILFSDPVDLSSPQTDTYRNSQARRKMGVGMAMWSGDVSFDGKVQYTGEGNDRDLVLQAIGGIVPTNTATGYGSSDLNLDGSTRYSGEGNDRDQILRTIGGVVPTNIREGYLPKDSLTLRPNVHIVDPLAWELDTALSAMTTRDTLVFHVNSTMEGIETGHVVVGGEYGGYLRRVIAVDSSGTILSLVTEQGSFYDLFASGTLVLETPLNSASQAFTSFNAESRGAGVDIVFPGNGCVQGGLEDMDVSLNGTLQQIGEFTSTPLGDVCSWAFNGGIRMNGKLSLGIGACGAPIEEEILLTAPVPFAANVPVPVAPGVIILIPIAGTFEVNGILGLEVMTGTSYGFNNTFNLDINGRVGVDFDHGLPRPIIEMTTSSPRFEQLDVEFGTSHAECELTAGIKLGIELYKVAGPYLSFVGSHAIELNASQTSEDKDIEYKNTYKLIPGLEADLWKKFDVNFEFESPTIVDYVWPGKLELISDSLPLGPEEYELDDPIQVRVSGKLEILGQDIPMPPASNVPVSFNVLNGGGYILEEGIPVLTDALGIAKAHWTLGTIDAGEQMAQARVLTGSLEDIEEQSPLPLFAGIETYRMEIVSGDEQIGSVNSELMNPLVVRVVNQLEEPVEAFPVHFEVAAGTGSVSNDFVSTSSEGLASTMFTLGFDAAAQNKVKAYALTLAGDTIADAPVYFKAYIDPDTMMFASLSGHHQFGPANAVLPIDLRVLVNSVQGQEPQEGVLVFFEVVSGGGSVSNFGTSTNSDGIASVAYTLGPVEGEPQAVRAWAIDVYGDTLRGGPLMFEANTSPDYQCTMTYEMISIGSGAGSGVATLHVTSELGYIPEPLNINFLAEASGADDPGSVLPAWTVLDVSGTVQASHTFGSTSIACEGVIAYVINASGDTVCGCSTEPYIDDPFGFEQLIAYTDPEAACYEIYAACYPPPCEFTTQGYCSPGGTDQVAPPSTPLPYPIKVVALNALGQPVANYPVCARPGDLLGSGAPGTSGYTVPASTLTDANGVASFQWVTGTGAPHQYLYIQTMRNAAVPTSSGNNNLWMVSHSCLAYPGESNCP